MLRFLILLAMVPVAAAQPDPEALRGSSIRLQEVQRDLLTLVEADGRDAALASDMLGVAQSVSGHSFRFTDMVIVYNLAGCAAGACQNALEYIWLQAESTVSYLADMEAVIPLVRPQPSSLSCQQAIDSLLAEMRLIREQLTQ